VKKYREGKLKRTPEGELKDLKLSLWNRIMLFKLMILSLIDHE